MKEKIKRIVWLTAFILIISILSGIGIAKEKTTITILIGKEEIAQQFDETVKFYNATHANLQVKIVPLASQNAYQRMAALYAADNAPTIMQMGQEFDSLKGKLLSLSSEPWVKHTLHGTTDFVEVNGKVYGMPMTVEAFGFIYNQKVLDKAVGGKFNPSTIKTRNDLKKLLESITRTGADGIQISPMDWSLGAHYTNIFFTAQSADRTRRHQFMTDLKAGKVNLGQNNVYKGWLDTFDLMKEFNLNKKSALSPTYDDGTLALANGKIGLWFMGNWVYPQLKEINSNGQFGFLPVPISNNPNDYGNQQISVGVPMYWVIDASQSKPAEQQAAKDFLKWLVMDKKGQDFYVNKLNFIPVFDNFKVQPKDTLSKSILNYMKSGKTLEWMNTYYPADAFPSMGAAIQQYLVDRIERTELNKMIENYWKNVK